MVVKEKPRSKFLLVKCKKCNNEQIIFNKPAGDVQCLVCGEVIAKSTGGKAEVLGEIIKELE